MVLFNGITNRRRRPAYLVGCNGRLCYNMRRSADLFRRLNSPRPVPENNTMNHGVLRNTSRALLVCLSALWLPVAPLHAALIDTPAVIAPAPASAAHRQVREFLTRAEVRDVLQQQGLDQQAALARVDAMTAAEAQQLADQLDQLPAGGSSVLGVLFAVFVILLVTDILGFTKVFPFTRSVR